MQWTELAILIHFGIKKCFNKVSFNKILYTMNSQIVVWNDSPSLMKLIFIIIYLSSVFTGNVNINIIFMIPNSINSQWE